MTLRHLMIIGSPNSGKTHLYNRLTKQKELVGNWSGVTVGESTANYTSGNTTYRISDLPGIYSIYDQPDNEDEKITLRLIQQSRPDIIIHTINALKLERDLRLTCELLSLNLPMVMILTMNDAAKKMGIRIDTKALSACLQATVLESTQTTNDIYQSLEKTSHRPVSTRAQLIDKTSLAINYQAKLDQLMNQAMYPHAAIILTHQALMSEDSHADLILADAYYQSAHEISQQVQKLPQERRMNRTARYDKILLHRVLGLPIFFLIMYLVFFFAMHVGGLFQPFFDGLSEGLFVQGTRYLLASLNIPDPIITLLADGVGKGLNTTSTFIPVLGAMYFILTLIENSGYMARAAFLMDRLMRLIGLPGKAFVPLMVGFGCNVPAILATRTLGSQRDRILTTLMAPFMSCSARLTIYTVFVSSFFPGGGTNVIFSLYLLGMLIAIFTGLLLKKIYLTHALTPLILELPDYQAPPLKELLRITKTRLQSFLVRAAKLIIPTCFLISLLQLLPNPMGSPSSLLAFLGQSLSPLFHPIGLSSDNWPAVVGLITGILAKEVVISSMNTLYLQLNQTTNLVSYETILQTIQQAFASIPEQLQSLSYHFLHPLQNAAQLQSIPSEFHSALPLYFHSKASVYAYLVFILLYLPCISTMAAIKQEIGKKWMWFSILWSFGIAYSSSCLTYQLFTFSEHPLQSFLWWLLIPGTAFAFMYCLRTGIRPVLRPADVN